ncbi:MAG: helix-turn-helix domain-containing protein [Elusimicrobiota bacterium]|nr:helix-turn-helix domain-containing protein [Endomicrobiia bacterium]MCX7910825.1 helix-turn-helix domain-containing protein [Endomicrobiia bacterium]MDW8166514.1 helix-turn-helix domain-containing protein [Elusimicrobiota bacterium]
MKEKNSMMDSSSQFKEIMDVKELSKYLGIGKSKIYQLIREKKIPASKIGRQYRFSKSVIDSWLKENLITREELQYSLEKLFKKDKSK